MLDAEARQSVAAMMEGIRPFVERRVRSSADVDDILQDVFLRLHRGLPSLRDAERFGPWLYRIVRNAITDRYRVQAREVANVPDMPAVLEEEDADSSFGLTACIAPFVARLPSPYREAVTLVDLEDVTHKDAADMLGISIPGVKSRVQRGRAKLRVMFDECCNIELDARRRVTDCQRGPGKGCKCS
jgi:RNA polymerase sigma-70 factor (ECF subfamily)